jgi:hypothetical protein
LTSTIIGDRGKIPFDTTTLSANITFDTINRQFSFYSVGVYMVSLQAFTNQRPVEGLLKIVGSDGCIAPAQYGAYVPAVAPTQVSLTQLVQVLSLPAFLCIQFHSTIPETGNFGVGIPDDAQTNSILIVQIV